MEWITANGFWVLIFIAFVAMHMFGHGGHGGSARNKNRSESDKDGARGNPESAGSGVHQH